MNSRMASLLLAAAALVTPAFAQSDDGNTAGTGGDDGSVIDEITVRGQKPAHEL